MKRRRFAQSDQVRLQLQWLDEYASEHPPLGERIFSKAPVLPLAVSLTAGIIFFELFNFSAMAALVILSSAALLLFAFNFFIRKDTSLFVYLTFTSACILFFCLGWIRMGSVQYQGPDHISRLVRSERVLATVQGIVQSNVFVNQPDDIPWLGAQSSFYLDAAAVHTAHGWQPCSGKIRVQISDSVHTFSQGNKVRIYCWLSEFTPPANPGQFDIRTSLSRRGVTVSASVPGAESIEVLDGSSSSLATIQRWLRFHASETLLDETMNNTDARSLTSALLLGQRGELAPSITEAFRKTGLAHFISLSGMHVGILAGSIWGLLRMAGVLKRPRAMICIMILVMYALIVPPRAPTMRAVFLSCFFFCSVLLRRNASPMNTLGLSAIVLLMFRPFDVFNPGWQLSFACVAGILIFHQPVEYHLLSRVFYPILSLISYRYELLQQVLYLFVRLLSVGIAAWLAGAPIILYHFGSISLLSPLWTVLTFPFVLLIVYAGFAKLLIGTILPTVGTISGLFLNILTRLFESVVHGLSTLDMFHFSIASISITLIILFYILVISLRYLPFRFLTTKKVLVSLLSACVLAIIVIPAYNARKDVSLEMTCLSIGHGQALILSSPDNRHYLFDAGSITHQDITNKTILPFMQARGIDSFDAVFLSHGDMDHINAVEELASADKVVCAYANATLLETAQKSSIEQQLIHQLDIQSIPVKPAWIFTSDSSTVLIKSIWPDKETASDLSASENNKSEVFLVEYAGRKILLCGDIEREAQRRFIDKYPMLDVDVLLMPHHGSTTNLDDQFVENLNAEVIIASGSKRNLASAYRPAEDSAVKAFYTARDGAVTVKIKADGTIRTTGFLSSN